MLGRDDEIQVLRAKSETWTDQNPVLLQGEHGYEKDTGKFKIGTGNERWNELPYFIPESAVLEAINTAIASLPPAQGGGGEVTMQMFIAHVNSLAPHPVYDDGESFLALYRNAKV